MTRRYTKDNVTYDVDKLSAEGVSHFEVLVAAKRKARASVITLVSGLDKYLSEEAIISED